MNFDMHSHFIPQEFVDAIAKPGSPWQAKLMKKGDEPWIVHDQGYSYPLAPDSMTRRRVWPTWPAPSWIWLPFRCLPRCSITGPIPSWRWMWRSMTNDGPFAVDQGASGQVRGHGYSADAGPGSGHEGVAPLRAGIWDSSSIQIGSNVQGVQFDDPQFLRFFKECEALGVFILFHPYYVGTKEMFTKYYLTNLYGNPLDTAMCVASLIFGGVLEKCPKLKVGFTHGGGFFPYQLGRLKHGYEVRNEPKVNGAKSPEKYLHQLYFDTIVFMDKQLRFLVDMAGADHVMLGTDYAFDMAEFAPVDFVSGAGLPPAQLKAVLSDNAREMFGVGSAVVGG